MLRSRFIPVLLLSGSGLIKTKQFKRYKYLGDIINTIKIFNEKKVDELCIFDLSREPNEGPNFDLLEKVAKQANMPLCYGGSVSSLSHAEKLISIGYEKVSVSREAINNPNLISEISRAVGKQSLVVTVDIRKSLFKGYEVFTARGTKKESVNLFKHIEKMIELGAGEICINNIDRDGMRTGYDISLAKKIDKNISIPQTYVGGAGSIKDLSELSEAIGPVGVGVGSEYVFRGRLDAVLINYYRP